MRGINPHVSAPPRRRRTKRPRAPNHRLRGGREGARTLQSGKGCSVLKESNPRLRQSWEGVYARGAGGNHPHRAARPAVLPGPGRHNPAPTTRNSDNKDSSEEPARGPGPLQRGEEAGLTDGRRRRRSPTPRLRAPAPSVEALPSLNPSSGPRNSSGGSREQLPLIPSACSRPQAAATHSGGRCPTRRRGARRRSAQLAVWRYYARYHSTILIGRTRSRGMRDAPPQKVARFRSAAS